MLGSVRSPRGRGARGSRGRPREDLAEYGGLAQPHGDLAAQLGYREDDRDRQREPSDRIHGRQWYRA